MDLNNLQLNPQLLADLYKDTLIEPPATPGFYPPPASAAGKEPVRFLGKNEKNIVIVVSNGTLPFLSDTELTFLTNILSACKLSLADVSVINVYNKDEAASAAILDQLGAQSVLLFGIEPLSIGLPMNFPPFQVQSFNKRMYLQAPPFAELEKDKALKSKLWNSLKTLFRL